MKKYIIKSLLVLGISFMAGTLAGQTGSKQSGITIVSYILRDRAVIIDSLVMRKTLYVAFKTALPLSEVRKCAAAGILSHSGTVISRDTAWLFDEAAGNLGFNLPYSIPEGNYSMEIKIINPGGKIKDSITAGYNRIDFKPYYNREINFWDFTTPYAHLECSGFGKITYNFISSKDISSLKRVVVSARMNSDNDLPGIAEAFLNGKSLGKFQIPAGDPVKTIVRWETAKSGNLDGVVIRRGENQLSFEIKPEAGSEGMGLRIYSHKNSTDPSAGNEMTITLEINYGSQGQMSLFSIPVWGEEGEHITSKFNLPATDRFIRSPAPNDDSVLQISQVDVKQGYVLFSRNFQRYVYPWTIPGRKECLNSLSVKMGRNDFEPVTLGIYPIRDLGDVNVTVSDLAGPSGRKILSSEILVQVARIMKIRTGEGANFQAVPRLLDRTSHTNIPIFYTTLFWLTVHDDSLTLPGKYEGVIKISSEKEGVRTLPLTVDINPVVLEPVPGIDYSMCMSYEFFEMENKEWSSAQKEKIYKDGINSFRDYINHGMSTVVVASPYYFQWNKDGTPQLEHLDAMLRAAKETGFKRTVYWYFGHYVQATKGQHPGNISLYDPKIHPQRARLLVETALKKAALQGGPPIGFMPIDEPRIALRKQITLDLFSEIKKVPDVKIMCTTDIGGELLDIENNSQADRKPLKPGEKIRKSNRKVWEYDNTVVDCLNPCYSRYIYGYYTWRQDLDGMNSWGPGTTENSRGNPYEDLDHEYSDYAITYPHTGGPLATPNWEALREGIDDIRYVYQLEKLCLTAAQRNPEEVKKAEKFLDSIRDMCDFDDRSIINEFGNWTPERFDSLRAQTISWITTLQALSHGN